MSPFGAGGINPYAYCAGDPVNHTDPSGHINSQGVLSFIGLIAGGIGLVFSLITAGSSIAAAGSILAAMSATSTGTLLSGTLGFVSDAAAIVSGGIELHSPEDSSVLGWISMATGVAGILINSVTSIAVSSDIASMNFRNAEREFRSGLHQDEMPYYDVFMSRGYSPRAAAAEARRVYRERRGNFSNASSSEDRPSGRSEYRSNTRSSSSHNIQQERNDSHLNNSPIISALDEYPIIRNIINNRDNPRAVYPEQMSHSEFRRNLLNIHPDRFPDSVNRYATSATQIYLGWRNQLVRETTV